MEEALRTSLTDGGFLLQGIRLSDCLEEADIAEQMRDVAFHARQRTGSKESRFDRYVRLAAAALLLRKATGQRDAVVTTAIQKLNLSVRAETKQRARKAKPRPRGVAFLFRNVMHPKEVERLRKLYDRQFFLISIYSPEDSRQRNLASRLGDGRRQGANNAQEDHARELIRSETEYFKLNQQYEKQYANVRRLVTDIPKTFQHGDLFLDASDSRNPEHIRRFIELVFGHPFHTPSSDEVGMADAFAAALQSGNLARQVGAAITTDSGDLLAVGTNDVPRPGGGVYRSDDKEDHRDWNSARGDFERGFDGSDTTRRHVLGDLVHRMLADPDWLRSLDEVLQEAITEDRNIDCGHRLAELLETKSQVQGDEEFLHNTAELDPVIDALIGSDLIWESQFFDVLEYGRTMHAEMDAITSAARKGISVRDATLYVTTLPCHECARLIIGAGIRRVIFIEPYEKSRVDQLYDSEIRFTTLSESRERHTTDQRVDFVPYVGISPRRFQELFAFVPRKAEDLPGSPRRLTGLKASWEISSSPIRESIASESAMNSYRRLEDLLDHEQQLIDELAKALTKGGLADSKKGASSASS